MSEANIQRAAGGAPEPATAGEIDQYLTFMLGGDLFAIHILAIKEIIEYTSPTTVPMMPHHVRGVINLRGAVVPVFDLLVRFGKERVEVTKRTCIVIIELPEQSEHQQIGLVVDAVNAVVEIPKEDIEPPPSFGARIRAEFIRGMGNVDNHFVILLDVAHVLCADDIAVLSQATNAASDSAVIPSYAHGCS